MSRAFAPFARAFFAEMEFGTDLTLRTGDVRALDGQRVDATLACDPLELRLAQPVDLALLTKRDDDASGLRSDQKASVVASIASRSSCESLYREGQSSR